ncbi:PA0069 family radical SAM protein [Pseudofulvimonas gallinarii]|uniref:DNA repair photolyase n=1 Tax=Pseudofulvimonas gallinarii TaxID=634155 RepID=A0A4R3LSJ7_9GAMM|nr:PA0069 family radical SAM protein [Pseudofulvimonas gallinarii]TCT01187.1 DNA repair photolyase [Pseudofulvimonas gallinarii]THD14954.1 radical SAM protein [Pseudofulvimonas gallinarii]
MALKSTANDFDRGAAKGRGAVDNREGRYEKLQVQVEDDGWYGDVGEEQGRLATTLTEESARSIVQRNDSPDSGPDATINPYRGCEHGCIYCYARPSHSYLGLSPGLDFETRLFAKGNAVEVLRGELSRPGYRPVPVMLGANTDAYQPVERRRRLTRGILQVLAETRHPVHIVTKNALVERDIDLLADMAAEGLASVSLSITTLDTDISRYMEPRASAPARRVEAIRRLADAGVPVGVNVAPVVPFLTDDELETILSSAAEAGARHAAWVLLRLPWEVAPLFRDWLQERFPLKAAHVMSRMQQMRGGRDYDSDFSTRMRGTGPYAQLAARRFDRACARLGLSREFPPLDPGKFRRPSGPQLTLF